MNCKNCGAPVLKNDQVCKKCGATLIEAAEAYAAGDITRSRFTLLFKAWLGSWRGAHLKWLGYEEKAAAVKEKYGWGVVSMLTPAGWLRMFISICYHVVEQVSIIFGKYRTDADGHPVRYFKKKE